MPDLDLHISSRLKEALPPLTAEEKQQLEANLVADGEKLKPLVYWNDGQKNVIVDGMHSWAVLKKHPEVTYRTKAMSFASYDDAKRWMLEHALGQRNLLSPHQQRKTLGQLYNLLKSAHGGDRKSDQGEATIHPQPGSSVQNEHLIIAKTSEEIAEKYGVSQSKVRRDGKYAERLGKLDSALRTQIDEGKPITDDQLKRAVSLPVETQREIARALRVGQAQDVKQAFKQCKVAMTVTPRKQQPQSDYGKCPNCAGTKWTEDDSGVACAKCHHPHGESVGDVDGDRIKIQRSKTIKTVEALTRAFDDLHMLLARKKEHAEAIKSCKELLAVAKSWK